MGRNYRQADHRVSIVFRRVLDFQIAAAEVVPHFPLLVNGTMVPLDAPVAFRRKLLGGERVLHFAPDPELAPTGFCEWLRQAFRCCFYKKPSSRLPVVVIPKLPRVRVENCC